VNSKNTAEKRINSDAIIVRDLSYHYPDGTPGINDITFQVQEFEKVAIIGPNGSGKSTLVTLLNGVRRGKGGIRIFGISIDKHNLPEIKKKVGLVFQNPDDQLFCPTIFEDVAFGPLNLGLSGEEVRCRVKQALLSVGLANYDQRSSFHLSFGERKLASIATVLSMDPAIIVFDEPTSNLDLAHRRKIITWLKKSNKTILLTTHDLDMALDTCERVILLNAGKIIVDGEAGKILRDKELLENNDLELPISLQKS
jgi:cobalt/nickel transport system ATP-binding protein